PYTPLIRGYAGDKIQLRTLVGAHLQPHALTVHGVKWLFEPSYKNSGWRNTQGMGLSEHFELLFELPSDAPNNTTDYFYSASTGAVGLSNGLWGIMRSYPSSSATPVDYLKPLASNRITAPKPVIDFATEFGNAKVTREFMVTARIVSIDFNKRANAPTVAANAKALADWGIAVAKAEKDGKEPPPKPTPTPLTYANPNGLIFVLTGMKENGVVKAVPMPPENPEPLILRAAAGEWIKVTLTGLDGSTKLPNNIAFPYGNSVPFNGLNDAPDNEPVGLAVTPQFGLHPQLVAFQSRVANGINVGINPQNTVGPNPAGLPNNPNIKGNSIDYYWYAGEVTVGADGKADCTPIEFGATNLVGCDLVLQTAFGAVGALVIEPEGSTWKASDNSQAFATVWKKDGTQFKECVLVMQNLAAGQLSRIAATNSGFKPLPDGMTTILTPGRETSPQQTDGRQAGFGAVNFRTESFAARNVGGPPPANEGFGKLFSNSQVGGADPETPVFGKSDRTPDFIVEAGTPVRFRVVMPSTTAANSVSQPLVIDIHGHGWQAEPYINGGTEIGNNVMSQFVGAQKVTVTQKYDFVIDSAGGAFNVPGDYLYQVFNQEQKVGVWGIFRVSESK
ncbi:MAG: hypothetical protein ABI614_17355, partial [Planctomycetota bacterium]